MTQGMRMLARTIVAMTVMTTAAGTVAVVAQDAAASKAAEAVKAADLKRFAAQTTNDFETLNALMADDLVYVHSSAAVDTKAAYIETLRSGKTKYHTIEPSDMKVRVYGTTAIVTGLAKLSLTSNGKPAAFSLRFTDVWVQRDNKWQMVSWQSTRLPEPAK
jgi:ketosteroid isomerase-like protein